MVTAWNNFVKKIYHMGRTKNPLYLFKDALKDASKRKGEMGSSDENIAILLDTLARILYQELQYLQQKSL